MGTHSGKYGVVDGVSTVKQWSISDTMESQRYTASNTKRGMATLRGKESWSGSWQSPKAIPDGLPGDLINFLGFTAPNAGGVGVGLTYAGQAMIKQVQINWNWGTGEPINHQVDFDGHLALVPTEAHAQVVDDAAVTGVKTPPCTKITYSTDLSTWTDWTNLLTAQLTLTSALKPFSNSSTVVTDSGICRLWTGQEAGPIDIQASIVEQDTTRARFKKGDQIGLRFYITNSLYYELVYGRIKEFTGLTVNVDSGEIMQQTVNIEMDAVKNSDGTLGHFKMTDGSVWWPNADES